MAAKKGLGKGLDSLITNKVEKPAEVKSAGKADSENGAVLMNINKVEPNREQPRKKFDEDALLELSESIKQFGVLQPLLVTEREDYYEIIAGERRWRAAKLAGVKEVPVIIKKLTEKEIMIISLLENIQREDLNPIEEAMGYKRLIEEFGLKQEEVAECVSKSRSAITNSLRLLKLSDKVQQILTDKDSPLSMGHARALLAVEDEEKQTELAEKIIKERLSVREVEKLVKNLDKPVKEKPAPDTQLQAIYESYEEKIKQSLATKVKISPSTKVKGAGKFEIEFYSTEDFERILERIMSE